MLTRPTYLGFGLGVIIALAGCTDTASEHIGSYEALIHEMEEENALHAANIESASDMDAIHTEEERYAAAMDEMTHEMEGLSESLDACEGMSMGSSMMGMGYESMIMMTDEILAEMEDHSEAMDDAKDLDDAEDMEGDYQATMDDRMHAMEEHGVEMGGSQMACE